MRIRARCSFVVLSAGLAFPAGAQTADLAQAAQSTLSAGRVERYSYETYKASDEKKTRYEKVGMEIRQSTGEVVFVYVSEKTDGKESVRLTAKHDGTVVSAVKEEYDKKGEKLADSRLWVEEERACVERVTPHSKKTKRSGTIGERKLAADCSLLFLLRSFPFDGKTEWKLLVAAFSQHFVTMNVRQLGEEKVSTAAGEFECYKLEGVVDLFITSIGTTYWLSKTEPHFLVKYEGKRGILLAPTYVTTLLAVEK